MFSGKYMKMRHSFQLSLLTAHTFFFLDLKVNWSGFFFIQTTYPYYVQTNIRNSPKFDSVYLNMQIKSCVDSLYEDISNYGR